MDLRPLNAFLSVPSVKYETLSMLPALCRRHDLGVSVDMEQGYYVLGVHEMHQQFLCFAVAGVFYQYTALPMGCSISPLVYTKCMRVVARFLRYPSFTTGELYRTAGVSP